LLAIVTVSLIGWRIATQARAELDEAKAHQEAKRTSRAVEHYRRALRWSLPFDTASDDAVESLQSIARASEAAGDPATALLAWRSLAGSLAARRSLYAGAHPARERAKDEIARLVAQDEKAAIDAGLSAERLASEHQSLLDRQASPAPLWATLLLLGFAVWLASLFALIVRGFDSQGSPRWPEARAPLWGALAGFVSFVLGLLFA
jgi:hypothetical protein